VAINKRNFLNIYGFNNKHITSSEIADFIMNIFEDQSKHKYEGKKMIIVYLNLNQVVI